jgi:hypothetical protein
LVVGIGHGAHGADLRSHGAGLVVADLGKVELLGGHRGAAAGAPTIGTIE